MSRFEPSHMVLMGVASCGKSSVGAELSERIEVPYQDGDDLHSIASVAKMREGTPLTDADRWPWLERCGQALAARPRGLILGCSALRRSYRDRLRGCSGRPDLLFVHLSGDQVLLHRRMGERQGHYMPLTLLRSQLTTLELPDKDENALTVDIDRPVPDIVSAIVRHLDPSA